MLFCDAKESIQHLFFGCPLAKLIWRIIHMTFVLKATSVFQQAFEPVG
jgi:hypothetical protein